MWWILNHGMWRTQSLKHLIRLGIRHIDLKNYGKSYYISREVFVWSPDVFLTITTITISAHTLTNTPSSVWIKQLVLYTSHSELRIRNLHVLKQKKTKFWKLDWVIDQLKSSRLPQTTDVLPAADQLARSSSPLFQHIFPLCASNSWDMFALACTSIP